MFSSTIYGIFPIYLISLVQSQEPDNGGLLDFLGGVSRTDEYDRPADSELVDIFWPRYSPANISVYEVLATGDTIAKFRARHPEKAGLQFECFDDRFFCLTQSIGKNDWELEVALDGEEFDYEVEQAYPLIFAAWAINEEDNTLKFYKNYTTTISIKDVNDNAPQFSAQSGEIAIPEGTPPDAMLETQIYVRDLDSGSNADLSIFCVPETSFPPEGCSQFNVVAQKMINGRYVVKMLTTPQSSLLPAGTFMQLNLTAVDNPRVANRRLSSDLLLNIMIQNPEPVPIAGTQVDSVPTVLETVETIPITSTAATPLPSTPQPSTVPEPEPNTEPEPKPETEPVTEPEPTTRPPTTLPETRPPVPQTTVELRTELEPRPEPETLPITVPEPATQLPSLETTGSSRVSEPPIKEQFNDPDSENDSASDSSSRLFCPSCWCMLVLFHISLYLFLS